MQELSFLTADFDSEISHLQQLKENLKEEIIDMDLQIAELEAKKQQAKDNFFLLLEGGDNPIWIEHIKPNTFLIKSKERFFDTLFFIPSEIEGIDPDTLDKQTIHSETQGVDYTYYWFHKISQSTISHYLTTTKSKDENTLKDLHQLVIIRTMQARQIVNYFQKINEGKLEFDQKTLLKTAGLSNEL